MNRKDLYKQGVHSISDQRTRRRGQEADLRKERRERLLTSKRIRFAEEVEAEENIEEFSVEQVREFAKAIQKHDQNTLHCLRSLRKAFAQGSALISAFLGVENGLRAVVTHLTGHNIDLQLESAWCITNMSAGTHEDTLTVLKATAPYLITYLSGQNVQLQDQCAWALGNMSGDSVECRDLLRSQGIIGPMVNLLKSGLPSVVQSAAFALSNLARGQNNASEEIMNARVAPLLVNHLIHGKSSADLVAEVAWVLTYLTSKPDNLAQFVSLGIIDVLVKTLCSVVQENPENNQVITPILRCLGNIASGPDEYGSMIMQDGTLLPTLATCFQLNHRHIRKESLWVMTNLTAGPAEHAGAVVSSPGIIQVIVHMLTTETYDIKREAALTLCNIAYHSPEFLKAILSYGGMAGFVNILKSHDQDAILTGLQFAEMALRIFPESKNSFEEAEGVACLEGLEYNSNQTLRQYANELLDTYFMEEEEEDEEGGGEDIDSEFDSGLNTMRSQEINMAGTNDDAS